MAPSRRPAVTQDEGPPDRPGRGPSRRAVVSGIVAVAALSPAACSQPADEPTAQGTTGREARLEPTGAPTSQPSRSSAPTSTTTGTSILARPGDDITTGPADRPFVALTFHGAGDPGLAAQALSVAAAARAGLTVFAVGQWLDANPRIGRAIIDAGHDLGNHTWSHLDMPQLNLAQATVEVRRGADAVRRSVGDAGLLFRPSGTPSSTPTIRMAATAAGYARCVGYSVDPADYTDPGADLVLHRTLDAVKAGSIVSLHLGHAGTITALPTILTGLQARGLTSVPITRLVG